MSQTPPALEEPASTRSRSALVTPARERRFDALPGLSTAALVIVPTFVVALWFATDLLPHPIAFAVSLTPLVVAGMMVVVTDRHASLAVTREVARIEVELRRRLRGYDPAASVISRTYFVERLRQEIRRSERYHLPLTVILLKVAAPADDDGSLDALTAASADIVSTTARLLRSEDILGYLGDLEYAFCLPHTAAAGADVVLGRLGEALTPYGPLLGLAELKAPSSISSDDLFAVAREDAQRRAGLATRQRTWNEDLALT